MVFITNSIKKSNIKPKSKKILAVTPEETNGFKPKKVEDKKKLKILKVDIR